ncbi:YhgE/Pip domain-containing protein [Streptomyces sp. 1222.5]|uniref:YhgE/Pip domain-containing protein n=1 Tax=Streptomyces sp. 1222.5 TaxID=1881026 RepID=UPI003EBBD9F2
MNLDRPVAIPAANGKGTTTIQAGSRLVDELALRHTFAWRTLSEKTAMHQLAAGQIYFALIVPERFSSDIAAAVQSHAPPTASLILQLNDANGYLIGTAADTDSLKEKVTTLTLDYMAEQTTDVWKDVRTVLDRALNTGIAGTDPQGQSQPDAKNSSGMAALSTSLTDAATQISQVNDIIQEAKSNSGTMASQLNNAAASAQSAQDNAGANNPALTQQSTSQANTQVRVAQDGIINLDRQLQTAATTTRTLLSRISAGTQNAQTFSKEIQALQQQLQNLAKTLPPAPADDLAAPSHQPITIQRHNLHPCGAAGSGLAPLALPLAGAASVLAALTILRPVNSRALASTLNSFTIARAGCLPLALIATLTACGLFIWAQVAMNITTAAIGSTLAVCALVACSTASLGHLLKIAFGTLGEGIFLLITAFQFGAAGALYPVETTNALFRNAHPYLPMTYAVQALRTTICGDVNTHLWRPVIILSILILATLSITTFLLARQRQWTPQRLTLHPHQRHQ